MFASALYVKWYRTRHALDMANGELSGMVMIVVALAILGALGLREKRAAPPVAPEECQD